MSGVSSQRNLTVLIMAGGTGGHVYPAIAVARQLIAKGHTVVWIGVRQGLEAELVPSVGIDIYFIDVAGLRGCGVSGWLLAPLRLGRAVVQALALVRKLRPQVALGMGGFASGPAGLAAWLLRCPLIVHEQNAVPGLTNRVLSRLARKVLESFPGSFPAARSAVLTGNPVRADICAVLEPDQRLTGRKGPFRVLVLGGSQGAKRINEVVPYALAELCQKMSMEVRHQTGKSHLRQTQEVYDALALEFTPSAYIENMSDAYAWADLAVCRAGAMTVSELAAAGVASILIPFPFAVDDHQTLNARYLVDAGAAVLMPETELEPSRLALVLMELGQARDRLVAMAAKARACALPNACDEVASRCLEVANA